MCRFVIAIAAVNPVAVSIEKRSKTRFLQTVSVFLIRLSVLTLIGCQFDPTASLKNPWEKECSVNGTTPLHLRRLRPAMAQLLGGIRPQPWKSSGSTSVVADANSQCL